MKNRTCICCHNENSLMQTFGLYIEHTNLKKYNWRIYLCDNCISIIRQEKYSEYMSKSLIFLRELTDVCYSIELLKDMLDEIVETSLYININDGIKEFKHNIKHIKAYQKEINEAIEKINNMYDLLMPELALIGLKKTASLYFSFTRKELITYLGINQNSINKFRKIHNITGNGYIYRKEDIEEILNLSK